MPCQVASQEGKYLAQLFSSYHLAPAALEPAGSAAVAVAAAPAAPVPVEPKRGFWGRRRSASAAPAAPAAAEERRDISINVEVPLPEDAPVFK